MNENSKENYEDSQRIYLESRCAFYPERSESQIEIELTCRDGKARLFLPMSADSMFDILKVLQKDSIADLNGVTCRAVFDDDMRRLDSIQNIVYDNLGYISNNPIL